MYKGNKEREACKTENNNAKIIQKNSELTHDNAIKIPKSYETSEKNNFENSGYQSD